MYMLLQEKNGNQYMSGDKIVSGMDAIENAFHNQEKVNGGVMNGTRHNEEFIKGASGRLEEQYGHSFIFREFDGENGL